MDSLQAKFESIGLSETKAKDTLKNKKLAPLLDKVIDLASLSPETLSEKKHIGNNLYNLATTITPDATNRLEFLVSKVANEDLRTSEQISAAIKYCDKLLVEEEIDINKFNETCGVGVVVTKEQIEQIVTRVIEENKEKLTTERYRFVFPLLAILRQDFVLKWANGGDVKTELDKQALALLGPKDERDVIVKTKGKAKGGEGKKEAKKAETSKIEENKDSKVIEKDPSLASLSMFYEGELSRLHKPGGNKQIKASIMEEHLKRTKGKVITRFPPEPNGFLHIGHAKAINVNFGYAQAHDGICYLRYDDTNPEAEEEIYFTSILKAVEWLGFKPFKVTYSSDYFDQLYELAVKLIKVGKAYICHCTGEEIHKHRGGDEKGPRSECIHRSRPIEESLKEFDNMKLGKYKEGEAILRMKMDMQSGNPQFWDLVAYRVLYTPHHRTKDKWCVYPTYDFTHCLVDSFEDITHSLCTLEFVQSRPSYYWLCDSLEVYKPVQWEYGRLNVSSTILSKRKILKLITEKYVNGWDDPRLYTLPSLRRRGVPPAAINTFVRDVGVTTSTTTIDVKRLDNYIRDHLNETAPRIMAILDPIKVVIENLPENYYESITVPNKPRDPKMGEHQVPFTNTFYIDASDFRVEDSKDYFRLAPNKTVGLLYVNCPISCTSYEVDEKTNKVTLIKCRYENEGQIKKPKTYIQWVAHAPKHQSPVSIEELRIYNPLFLHENPQDKTLVPNGFLSDVDPNSLEIKKGAIVETGIFQAIENVLKEKKEKDCLEEVRAQFIRVGYFCLDKDSLIQDKIEDSKLIFNRIVTLKEDTKKD
ncbi:glutaminyl-tRNA synthetase [Neoconidiobolus thromboides FSU 785]|nr:glutaminyl-tRNA synthetase [Neoconidiobolus thromboides FSU 785]